MEFELRGLKASDLFPLAEIVGKIGIEEIGSALPQTEEGQEIDVVQMTVAITGVVTKNLGKVETDLYKWLGSLAGMKPSKVADLSPAQFVDLIEAVVKLDDFNDFFMRVSRFVS